ncbi:MAG: hypothetical protein EXS36_12035 [Pedosphaera sp.]|nr:hypothetical protein [Pedosphaera sp.]
MSIRFRMLRPVLVLLVGLVLACAGTVESVAELTAFRFPTRDEFEFETHSASSAVSRARVGEDWIRGRRVRDHALFWFGRRIVIAVDSETVLDRLIADRPVSRLRTFSTGLYLLECSDAQTAVQESASLAAAPGVNAAHPVRRGTARLLYAYAADLRDPEFPRQWNYDHRIPGAGLITNSVDLNLRGAWPVTRGEGVVVGLGDDGLEATHPDLSAQIQHDRSFNYLSQSPGGSHTALFEYHGTATAGLIAASANNTHGGSGAAPAARIAPWVIFNSAGELGTEEQLADMFQGFSNSVPVQNHSWGNANFFILEPSLLEQTAITNAVQFGRNGLGVVMVRGGGNARHRDFDFRLGVGDANEDGYARNPDVISVAAARSDGRVSSYSSPGACLLLAAPSGDSEFGERGVFTTDRVGRNGINHFGDGELADYCVGVTAFSGTSAASAQIAGIVALMLSVRPDLAIRDIQQALLLSCRHLDLSDPDLRTNSAGLPVSHNLGFGIPNAAIAVRTALAWRPRPPLECIRFFSTNRIEIPDDALCVKVSGIDVPEMLRRIAATGGLGLHPDAPTSVLPLRDFGVGGAPAGSVFKGSAALILRGGNTSEDKIANAAAGGAEFVILHNNEGGDSRLTKGAPSFFRYIAGTEFSPIPAVLVDQVHGAALQNWLQDHPEATAQLALDSARYEFAVTNTLHCEHVGVRIRWSHPSRADLRVTVRSPRGTVSILQRQNMAMEPVPDEQSFWSTHHFFEGTEGTWTLAVTDEWPGSQGRVEQVELFLRGVTIVDTDGDGLPDDWEQARFGSLCEGPAGDFDGDGNDTLHELLIGTDPTRDEELFRTDLSSISSGLVRVSWPGRSDRHYQLWSASGPETPFRLLQELPGRHPEAGLFLNVPANSQIYRIVSPGN